MRKFKIGDKVRLTTFNGGTAVVGDVGIVESFIYSNSYTVEGFTQTDYVVDDDHISAVLEPGTQLTKAEYLAFIEKTFAEMTTLIKAKNSDYTAGSDDPFANFRQSVDYGVDPLSGVMVRVGDKLQRIKSFTKAGKLEVANEGVEDAFKDLIGYSLIALGMLSERKPD